MRSTWKLIVLVFVLALLSGIFWLDKKKKQKEVIEQEKREEVSAKLEEKIVSHEYDFTRDFDISQWDTYKSERLGLVIKYPRSWRVIISEDEKAGIFLRSPIYFSEEKDTNYSAEIYVNYNPNPQNLSIKNLYGTFDDTSRFWFSQFPYEEIKIMGMKCIHFPKIEERSYSATGKTLDAQREVFLVPENRRIFLFDYTSLKEGKHVAISEILRKIVENFQIL